MNVSPSVTIQLSEDFVTNYTNGHEFWDCYFVKIRAIRDRLLKILNRFSFFVTIQKLLREFIAHLCLYKQTGQRLLSIQKSQITLGYNPNFFRERNKQCIV